MMLASGDWSLPFFHQKTPKELCREWQRAVRKEERALERQLRDISREEMKIKREVKALAKKGEMASVRTLAKELVRSQKAKERIYLTKAQMRSVSMNLQQQAATLRMSQVFEKSTGMMKSMNKLMDVYKTNETFREMQREMMKSGLIQEMMDDSLDSVLDQEGLDEEADAQVDQVVAELTMGMMDQAGAAPISLPPEKAAEAGKEIFRESMEDDTSELERRLEALQS